MFRSVYFLLTLVVAALPLAHAQDAAAPGSGSIIPVIGGGAGGGAGSIYVGGPGVYNQVNENVTDLAKEALEDAQINQEADRQFVLAAVAQIQEAYVEYSDFLVKGPLVGYQAKGINSQTITVEEFMAATANLKAKRNVFEALLVEKASINKETLPSNFTAIVSTDGTEQPTLLTGNVNLEKVVEAYQQRIKEDLDPALQSFNRIAVETQPGQVLTIADYKSLLDPDFSKTPPLTPEKISELTQKVIRLKEQGVENGRKERSAYGSIMQNNYNVFFDTFGTDFKYVGRSSDEPGWIEWGLGLIVGSGESKSKTGKGDTVAVPGVVVDTDMTARNNAFKHLVNFGYARSYLRLSEGVSICAIQPKKVDPTNFGGFEAVEAMREMRNDVACGTAELLSAQQSARLIIQYSGVQSEHVFDSNGFFKAGLLNKLGSATTFAMGNRQSAEALHMMIQLVYADIQEELLLNTQGQGLQPLRDMYVARYQSSPEQRDYFQGVKCAIDPGACDDVGAFGTSPGYGGTSDDIKLAYEKMRAKVRESKAMFNQARLIEETIEASQKGTVEQEQTDRRKSLL